MTLSTLQCDSLSFNVSRMLRDLRFDCLDEITLEIDSTKNLLVLCLASKTLYELVYERHLQFRHISCRLEVRESVVIWKLLAGDKG